MRILSMYSGHNASICVLDDGEIRLNWELERHTRIKHDYGFSEEFLWQTLALAGSDLNDIDFVCVNRGLPDDSVVRPGTVLRPFEIPLITRDNVVPFRAQWMGRSFDALAVNHHLAHAASAFFTSPFESAALLTYDGYGDAENASMAVGRGNRIDAFERMHFADLAGWWASVPVNNYRMPSLHERDPGSHAGKIMGLAAYGHHDEAIARRLEADIRDGKRFAHHPHPRACLQ